MSPKAAPHSHRHERAIAVALAELRGTMAEGFATVNGSLPLVTQRHDQTERSLSAHSDQPDALEARRWPLGTVSAVVAIAAP